MSKPIVHLCASPSPYRNAEWDQAAQELGVDAVHLIFVEDSYDTACWQPTFPKVCHYHCIDGLPEHNRVPLTELETFLGRLDPTMVIVSGYLHEAYRKTMRWCQKSDVPYCLRNASSIWSDRHKGWAKYAVRRFRLGRWVPQADLCLVSGSFNRDFWCRYGMRPEQEGWFPQWIDYDNFNRARELRRQRRDSLREKLGIRPPVTVFFAGRLLPYKRVDSVCEALCQLPQDVGLVVAGSGPEAAPLREKYQERLGDRLMLVGNQEPEQLPEWYAATDMYALPSGPQEIWGHVITEATTSSMPILCHSRLGAAGDLLEDGRNGIAVDSHDPAVWAEAIGRLAADEELRREMGEQSSMMADDWRDRSNPASCLRTLQDRYAGVPA